MILQFCGLEGEEKTSIAWFYREYCMKWLEECLGSSNRKNFSKESMSFFFELLLELAKSNVYRERVATIMAVFPMLMLSDDADSKSAELKINQPEVLDFLYQVILTVNMPFPKEELDRFLELLLYSAPVLLKTVDNKQKGYFLEFLEKCLDLKESGGVDAKLLEDVISSLSTIQYLG